MSTAVLEANNVDFDDIEMYSCSSIIFFKVSSVNNYIFYNNYLSELFRINFGLKMASIFFIKTKTVWNNKDLQYNLCIYIYIYISNSTAITL